MEIREKRKFDHIRETLNNYNDYKDYFNDVVLIPDAASTIKVDDVDLGLKLFGKKISAPLMINAMTGGARGLEKYNEAFAISARENNIPMAVGSQKAAIENPELKYTFSIARKINPNGLIFANISALESIDNMKIAVDMIKADALQLHVNHGQELSMAEGDRDFSLLLRNIEKAVKDLPVPVIVKEVGTGISRKAAGIFGEIGVVNFDAGGYGGTNFPKIEEKRQNADSSVLGEFGIPTPVSLIEIRNRIPEGILISSGGIRSSSQIVKSIVLGADIAASAAFFLKIFEEKGPEELVQKVAGLIAEIKKIMVVLGKKDLSELRTTEYILKNEVKEWIQQRY